MSTKKIILWSSLIIFVVIFVTINPLMFGFCKNIAAWSSGTKYCADNDILPEYFIQLGGFLSLLLLLLSLLTYRMKDEVFRAWFRFAAWFVPVIIATTFLLQNVGGGGGWGVSSGIFEFAVLWLLYIIFIAVSLIQIVRAYLKAKNI